MPRAGQIPDFVGVVASEEWNAVRAAQQLRVTWDQLCQGAGLETGDPLIPIPLTPRQRVAQQFQKRAKVAVPVGGDRRIDSREAPFRPFESRLERWHSPC